MRLTDDMDRELRAEARRRGAPEVEVIREALARDFGRTRARDEMTELLRALSENTGAITSNTHAITSIKRDLLRLLQQFPWKR